MRILRGITVLCIAIARAMPFGRTSPLRLCCASSNLRARRGKILHTAHRWSTHANAAGFSHLLARARARATLFIFRRCALTLPFVYAHKYSFKPPPWYPDEAIRLSSLVRDHQSSLDRVQECGRRDECSVPRNVLLDTVQK